MRPEEPTETRLACPICSAEGPPRIDPELVVAESPLWIVRHHGHPAPVAGWLQLVSRRHVQGPAGFQADEASDFGPALQEVSSAIERTLDAARVYAIAFGEGAPHLHMHLVPRRLDRPEIKAWTVADWYRAVEAGERPPAAPTEVAAAVLKVRGWLLSLRSRRWAAPSGG